MNKYLTLCLIGVALLVGVLLLTGSAVVQGTGITLQTTGEPAELPPDTLILAFDKPVLESLNTDNPSRLYKFEGKADQLVVLSITPKSGDFYTMITLLDSTLQNVIGGLDGQALVGGSLIVKLPADDLYVVSVDYGGIMPGTPVPGQFEILLSEFKIEP